jgi:hypothetical protein
MGSESLLVADDQSACETVLSPNQRLVVDELTVTPVGATESVDDISEDSV